MVVESMDKGHSDLFVKGGPECFGMAALIAGMAGLDSVEREHWR